MFVLLVICHMAVGQGRRCIVAPELVGSWEFIDLRDRIGVKVDTIWHELPSEMLSPAQKDAGGKDTVKHQTLSKLFELADGPKRTFREDGTYTKHFTPRSMDRGTWCYERKPKVLVQRVYYDKPYRDTQQFMIDRGYALKDEQGEYYGLVQEQILLLTDSTLVLRDREWRSTYKRVLNQ